MRRKWFLTIAVVVAGLVGATPAAAQDEGAYGAAAASGSVEDAVGDVGSPAGDIFGVAGVFEDGIATLLVGTVAQTGPDFAEWAAEGTYLQWFIEVDMFEGVDAVAWLYASGDEVVAFVEVPDTGERCDAVPSWGALDGGQGYIGLTFPGECANAGTEMIIRAALGYEEGGRAMLDTAPDDDGEALYIQNEPVAPVEQIDRQPPASATAVDGSDGTGDGVGGAGSGGGGSTGGGSDRPGYWMLGQDGSVWGFGPAAASTGPRRAPAVFQGATAIASTPSGAGYWVLHSDGALHASGDAAAFPKADMGAGERATSLSVTPDGRGLWVFTNRGRVITRGTAPSFGDASGLRLNGPIIGSVATPTGRGYYLVGSDGGVFSYGDARFAGSMGGKPLNAPVNGLVPDPDGSGYWLVASDGGVFAFGAPFRGAMPPVRVNRPVVGMVAYGDGYLMVGADGGIFTFSSSPFHGSLGASPPAMPVVAVAVQADVPTSAAASYTAAAAGWNRLNRDNDGWYDGWYWDGDGDGWVEYVYLDDFEDGFHEIVLSDTDEDGRTDQLWVDVEQNGTYEGSVVYHHQGYGGSYQTQEVLLDRDQNGRYELGYYDGDRNGTYEWVKQDTNGDGYADAWAQNAGARGTTAADSLARNVANVSAVNILHGAGLSVFFP